MLLLTPGTAQVYYGDETARSLVIDSTQGDATLRSFMNWEAIETSKETQQLLLHWRKLGSFRARHPAIGAGVHKQLTESPYVFSRVYKNNDFVDLVVIGLELPRGKKELSVKGYFIDGTVVQDMYSNKKATVKNHKVLLDTNYDIALLEAVDIE